MKKTIIGIAAAALVLGMTACGGTDRPTHKVSRTSTDLTVYVSQDNKFTYQGTCNIAFDMNFTEGVAQLMFNDISFAERMPAVSFALDKLVLGYLDDEHVNVYSTGTLTPADGYTITGLACTSDFKNKVLRLRMNVVSGSTTYSVTILSPTIYTYPQQRVEDGEGNITYNEYSDEQMRYTVVQGTFASLTDTYFSFVLTGDAPMLNFYNISFTEAMPKMSHLRASLKSAAMTMTGTGYTIHADEIVPEFLSGSTWTPMDTRTITNLDASVDYGSMTYALEFDCFGMRYSNSGKLFYLK